jgi:catechol 2,3-dioxygenase-like lactoylglutathione lyase family enzyme
MKNIRHFGIVTTDIEKSLHFYQDLLGLKIKTEALEEGSFIDAILGLKDVKVRTIKMVADEGNALVELLHYESHRAGKKGDRQFFDLGISHLALTVINLDEEYRRLKEAGVSFVAPPQTSPNGKAKVAFCYDPEQNPIELVQELN